MKDKEKRINRTICNECLHCKVKYIPIKKDCVAFCNQLNKKTNLFKNTCENFNPNIELKN